MNNKKIKYDTAYIESYLDGELQGEELELFENKMKSDSEFAREVKLHREINEFLRNKFDYIQKREQLEKIYEEVILKKGKPEITIIKNTRTNKINWYYRIAAGIALLIGVSAILFFILRPLKNDRLFAQYFKVYEASVTVRGANVHNKTPFEHAMEAYEDNDFETSYKLFDELCITEKEDTANFFFKGISAMKIEKFSNAVISFNVVLNSTSLYKDEAEWYLALCYLKMSEINKSVELLKRIVTEETHHRDDAVLLIDKLSE